MRFQFIEDSRSDFPLKKLCKVMQVSRSGFYKWSQALPSARARLKADIQERIRFHFHDAQRRYGAPKLTVLLRREGYAISERTVSLYMAEMKLRACVSGRFRVSTTDSNHDQPIAPNLLNQQFDVELPNQVWVADITYIPCREGRLYLASVMDLCTREIVGWTLAGHMKAELVLDALEKAYASKGPPAGLVHHSDRGSQYASEAYRSQLEQYGMTASMSRRGNCYDNASMESFHSILKKELVYCTRFLTRKQASQDMYRYIEFFYNRKRIHGSLGYLSPVRFAAEFDGTA
ncbi:IS3 family transposase [Paenibacillus albicereus]|uniref:IS3 family transposase n=1 Tax=Paenibacillus albicereus TaxID=2726185 RepID=A0A6H2GT25_9BACL|nr:IS3 family transposase [Paenibacillus albicereus]QJC50509.1 IS3 family transposase [Paenibacillus albicereus]